MTYEEALKSSIRQPLYKIEFCDSNENSMDEVIHSLISGSLSIELKNGIRRTCNLTFDNSSGDFNPNSDGLISLNNRVKIYTGLLIDGIENYSLRGIFAIGNPRITSNFSEKTATIEFYDKFSLLDGTIAGTLEADYIVNVGTPIPDVVNAILTDAGIFATSVIYPTSVLTPYTLTEKGGSTYAELLYKLADMLSWEVFFDVEGNLRFQPPTDEVRQAESWEFTVNETTYLGSVHNYEWNNIKNNVVVIGDNVDGLIYRATSSDTNIFSDTNITKIGKRTMVIEDSIIYSNSLAQQRADYELKKAIQVQESLDLSCIPIDILNEGDMILIEDASNDLNRDRYLIRTINYNLLNSGNMTCNVWKARSIV